MIQELDTWLNDTLTPSYGMGVRNLVVTLGIALMAVLFYYITKGLLYFVERLVEKSSTDWDDDLLTGRFLRAVSQLSPAIAVNWLLPRFWDAGSGSAHWLNVLTSFYILWAIVRIVVIFIGNLYEALARRDTTHDYAVKGVFQMVKLIFIGIGAIVGISILIGKSPVVILTALGASAAVLMLVFKDTLLGLVASVQLTANKMLRRGDWITCDKLGVNGVVEDVSLTTVKVRNWDNSVSTIPPYNLISDSFRNYEPMQRSGARRVERSVFIDVNTIGFLPPERLEELRCRGRLDGIQLHNGGTDEVNLSLFRAYMERYLMHHPKVRTDEIVMVRQMAPTPQGLPIGLYFFTSETSWKEFEEIQSRVFDHLYSVLGEFGLRQYQLGTIPPLPSNL